MCLVSYSSSKDKPKLTEERANAKLVSEEPTDDECPEVADKTPVRRESHLIKVHPFCPPSSIALVRPT